VTLGKEMVAILKSLDTKLVKKSIKFLWKVEKEPDFGNLLEKKMFNMEKSW